MKDEWKPGCPEWITEDNSPLAQEQRRHVLKQLVEEDYAKLPSEELVKAWHKGMFEGVAPCNDYVGQFRDQDRTSYCLQDYEVMVGGVLGTPSSHVLLEVDEYFTVVSPKLNEHWKSGRISLHTNPGTRGNQCSPQLYNTRKNLSHLSRL